MLTLYFLAIVLLSCTQSTLTKLYSKDHGNVWVFNIDKSIFAFLMFALIGVLMSKSYSVHIPTLLYALSFGVMMCVSMLCGYMALACGPMSITSLIVSFSLVIPSVYGICVLGEALTLFKSLGFILLTLSLVLFNIKKKSQGKASLRWGVYTALTLIANGVGSIIQKEHQLSFPGKFTTEFMRDSMLLCLAVFILIALFLRLRARKSEPRKKTDMIGHIYSALSGITNGGSYFFTLRLSGMDDASAVFPMISAGTAIAVFLAGRLIFKEKQSMIRYIALVLGIASVVLLKI